jgi:hypothetical protein
MHPFADAVAQKALAFKKKPCDYRQVVIGLFSLSIKKMLRLKRGQATRTGRMAGKGG